MPASEIANSVDCNEATAVSALFAKTQTAYMSIIKLRRIIKTFSMFPINFHIDHDFFFKQMLL